MADGAGAGGQSKPLSNVAGALAVLSGAVLAPGDTWMSNLGGFARVDSPTKCAACLASGHTRPKEMGEGSKGGIQRQTNGRKRHQGPGGQLM